MYKTIDLCAGIGGIRQGFERTGNYTNVLSVEIDEYAAKTYQHLFGDDPRGDLTSDEFKEKVVSQEYDILLAGFPCQPFSSQGNLEGFKDQTKGTIFFHIAEIIKRTRPKAIFLENVKNIVSHDEGNTIKVILDTLENKLRYKVVGVTYGPSGELIYNHNSFVRNTRFFGLPQNRPRAYFVAFDKDRYSSFMSCIPNVLPEGLNERQSRNTNLNKSLFQLLDAQVALKYYMSESYLNTLVEHARREKERGNGFGYCILNEQGRQREYANTILATGGSGKERNLICQSMPLYTEAEHASLRKKGGLNNKDIRVMTPTEWGRLQGFIGYGFINKNTGQDEFSFPENIPDGQKYKQFGNAVSISVIETMADYMYDILSKMDKKKEDIVLNLLKQKDNICRKDIVDLLKINQASANYLLRKMINDGSLCLVEKGRNACYVKVQTTK